MEHNEQEPIYWRIDDAAERAGIAPHRLRKWIWAGKVPSYSESPKASTFVKLDELLAFMDSLRVGDPS